MASTVISDAAPARIVQEADLVIREARKEDIDPLIELAQSTFRETYRGIDEPEDIERHVTTEFTPEAFAAMLANPDSTLLVALTGQRHVGYVEIRRSSAPACVSGPAPIELGRIYLREEVIGKGFGAQLMRAVHHAARRANRKTIWLGVYERNQRARDFYARWGFVDVGTREFLFAGRVYADPVMSAPVPDEE